MSISIAVMAHPSRAAAAERLAGYLEATIVWDEHDDEWDTGARAIAAYDPAATHHLVLQDDALPIPGFLAHAAAALAEHPSSLISFYLGTGKPAAWQTAVNYATDLADAHGAAWLSARRLLHGVAIAIPTADIPALLEWCAHTDLPYDERVGYFYSMGRDDVVLYTWPSLVDHADEPTLVRHADDHELDVLRHARGLGHPTTWHTPVVPI